MPPITVRPAQSRADRRRFLSLPYALYRDSACWVPPLRRDQAALIDPRRNAFFDHGRMQLFLAEEAGDGRGRAARGRLVGRIAAIVNGTHLATANDGAGFFGFFEHAADAPGAAPALLDAAAAWLRAQGLARMRGPVNPTLNDTAGCLVGGFDREPSIMMPYNLPHHAAAYGAAGFGRAATLWSYYGAWKHLDRDRLGRLVAVVQRRHPQVRLRTADARRFDAEVVVLRSLYNRVFAGGWGFVPLTDAEFAQMARAMRPIVDPRIVFVLEDAGRPVGFSLSLPNVNQLLRRLPDGRLFPFGLARLLAASRFGDVAEFRTILMGVLPEYRRRGLDALLVLSTIEEGRRAGYLASELGWVADDNTVLRNMLAKLGAVVDKEYALFERAL